MASLPDERDLLRQLIARPSVTPDEAGCLGLVGDVLAAAGFSNERLDVGGVSNLWSTWGDAEDLLVFAGHVDVVPPGRREDWSCDPFAPQERDGRIYGRGACDMKGSVAAMVCAAVAAALSGKARRGGLALLLTSDEEGPAKAGTDHVVRTLEGRGVRIRHCLVGEPTSLRRLGDVVKHGRRGTLSAEITVRGKQGHSAYPHLCDNALHRALRLLGDLAGRDWDRPDRDQAFPATSFQVVGLNSGVGATNVIPGEAAAVIDVRYAPPETAENLKTQIEGVLAAELGHCACRWLSNAQPYLAPKDSELAQALAAAIGEHAGIRPEFSTAGGTSDARFLRRISGELLEFGPLSHSMHQVDEYIGVDELAGMRKICESLALRLLS